MDSPHTRQSIREGDFCEGGGFTLAERVAMIGCTMADDEDEICGGASRRLRVTAAILSVVKVDSAEAIVDSAEVIAASVIRSWACSIGMFE